MPAEAEAGDDRRLALEQVDPRAIRPAKQPRLAIPGAAAQQRRATQDEPVAGSFAAAMLSLSVSRGMAVKSSSCASAGPASRQDNSASRQLRRDACRPFNEI